MAHYRIAISACASLGDGPRAAALLHRMQQRGMGYADAAADAMFACNKSGMGDVALDIFHGLVVESGGLRTQPGARLLCHPHHLRSEPQPDPQLQLPTLALALHPTPPPPPTPSPRAN